MNHGHRKNIDQSIEIHTALNVEVQSFKKTLRVSAKVWNIFETIFWRL